MFIRWRHVIGLVLTVMISVPLITWSGVIGVRASSGHWKVTDWFLHWAMRSSIRTAAFGTRVPELNEDAWAMAAAHFESACATCHGSPISPRPASVDGMLPKPPDLKLLIPTWSDAELFQIVQHGVRFTGMPAWPSNSREDEVWAIVAFLRRYPSLDAQGYKDLAGLTSSDLDVTDRLAASCNTCHAPGRMGANTPVPLLEGQSTAYLRDTLDAYANGSRPSGVMQAVARSMTAKDRSDIADYYSQMPLTAPSVRTQPSKHLRGEQLAKDGDYSKQIPACLSCHDKQDGSPAYPSLSGQNEAYIATQLRLFQAGTRGGGSYNKIMHAAAKNLTSEDVEVLAAYFSARQPD
jgi:cytochrome c553